jgi:ACS family hexuronate transporter-like MFS transporter
MRTAASARLGNSHADSRSEMHYRYRWVILGTLWVTYIIVFLNRLSVGPLGAFFKDELHITSAQVGFVLSSASLGYLCTQIPIGWLADRIGARWPIASGQIIAGFAMLAIFVAPSYRALLMFMFITGAGCGFLAPSTTQAVIVWFPQKERATVMGLKQTAVSLGGIVGAASLPTIALACGWRAGFLVLGVIALAAGVLSIFLYREPPAVVGDFSHDTRTRASPLSDILRNRQIWLVAMGAFFLNWIELAMIGHFVLYLKALQFPVVAAGGMLAMAESAGAVARPVSGLVSDRLFGGRRNPVFIAFSAIATLMCFVLGVAGPHLGWVLYPVIFVLGVGAIGFGGVHLTLLSELGGRGGAAKAAGFGSTIAVGGSIIGPPAFGRIVDLTGSYQIAWLSLAVVGVISVVVLSLVDESSRKI